MAHWFHRNPLKATTQVTFELHGVSTTGNTREIFSGLRKHRNQLLELLTDPNHEVHVIEKATNEYFALLLGLIQPFEEGDNKLRKIVQFKWTNSLLGNAVSAQQDTVYECASMAINVALWYTKHSAKIAAKPEPNMDEAKEVHKCLRTAAGIFNYIKNELIPKLTDNTENAVDTDTRVLDAYIHHCTAEAQEVTMARAIEMKHNPSLISALAYETAQIFKKADDALASLDEKVVGKWRKYFQLKSDFYTAYAYSYHGETLLAQDKCGEAIRSLQEAVKCYQRSEQLSRDYATIKGPGTVAKPMQHVFFRKLGPFLKRTLEKCERENGMIYHEKVPFDAPPLELKATYGLVSPEDYQAPSLNPLWTVDNYKSFNVAMAPKPKPDNLKKDEGEKKEEKLPPVKEKEFPMSDKDPNTSSGCIVS